jgi:hypothetical protein
MHELAHEHGFTAHIRSRGQELAARVREPHWRARRWVVEAAHSWLNRNRGILIRQRELIGRSAVLPVHRSREVPLAGELEHPPAAQAVAPRDLRTVDQAAHRGHDRPCLVSDLLLIVAAGHVLCLRCALR